MVQLFILPFAGGNSSSFQKMVNCIDSSIETVTIEYSGRGSRLKDGYITDYQTFVADVVAQIQKVRKQSVPYALFGYSMGAAFAYEIAANGYVDGEMKHIFYAGRSCVRDEELKHMTDEEFLEHTKQLGGFRDEVIKNKRLFNLFVHPLLDDYHIACRYHYSPGTQEIDCDATVFYSEKDTPFESVQNWRELTNGRTEFHEFGDNHFFILEHYREMADIVNKVLSIE